MSKIAAVLLTLIVMSGCAGFQAGVPSQPPSAAGPVPAPALRYRINYQDWGLLVVPGFGLIDRSKEWVVAPMEPTPFPETDKSEPQPRG